MAQTAVIDASVGDRDKGMEVRKQMNTRLEQLMNIFNGAVWDGNLISKNDRDELVKAGLVQKVQGAWNIITPKGVEYLLDLGLVSIVPRHSGGVSG